MAVLDASVLIALAKIRRLGVLRDTYLEVLIGPVVHDEVVTAGKRVGAVGVELVEQALDSGWLRLVRLTPVERRLVTRILQTSRLHHGEAEALAIAKRRGQLLVVDDKEARNVAGALGLDFVGAAGVLLEAFLEEYLTLEGLEGALMDLSRVTWLSPGVVATVLKLAREGR